MTPEQIARLKELASNSTDFYLSCKSAAAGLELPYPGQFADRINSAIADGELKGDVQRVALAVLDADVIPNSFEARIEEMGREWDRIGEVVSQLLD